jgi:hypothetical protein
MRDALAERLLATVMGWGADDVARERPALQAMAAYKYDEYQQFSPGMRFVESLGRWLSQFRAPEERAVAYRFVRERLVFCSAAEMDHLVSIAYADFIRPLLLREVAREQGMNEFHVGKIVGSGAFRIRQRQCLFLGLSDGARTDAFRRSNSPDISHEQVLQTYEISRGRVGNLLRKLEESLSPHFGGVVPADEKRFRTIVLLDDFSASGTSYLTGSKLQEWKGKIGEFHRSIIDPEDACSQLADLRQTRVLLVLYVATDQAREYLNAKMAEMWNPGGVTTELLVVNPLGEAICIRHGGTDEIEPLLDAYYDPDVEDEHTRKGGTDVKHGYAGCGLPVVLSHNTPNNSLCLLWAESPKVRPLFPRVSRHRKDA